ncbi:hypothetical protein [Rhodoferax saidenbachensis]|uniref:TIR domain-containing protein n=1 Tax=Rhodoferax saidenbachensis TaxID=1484693 RepID=A0ABU1ZTP8_9BURK|nr:hypothetical protein [Rhodoferax saidenbachensis]MDR7308930.1 hypothetical protein [Rhodoferax saidenbachensis]
MSIRTQFIYHPENDGFIAQQVLSSSKSNQQLNLSEFSIGQLNRPDAGYWNAMASVDVIVLLVSSTFNRIAPYIYAHDNFFRAQKGILGIDISSIPNEWGETRKKSNVWLDYQNIGLGKSMRDLIEVHNIPKDTEPYGYISSSISLWIDKAHKCAQSGYSNG